MRAIVMRAGGLDRLNAEIPRCERCAHLRAYCRDVARRKRRAFDDWTYWAKPVPGFGDPRARLWILGLAPAAHGANRTGRVFTGDRSGDFLFAALHRAGLANSPRSVSREDGLALRGVYISAALRCAPPENHADRRDLARCSEYLDRELFALERVKVLVCLGAVAWAAALALLRRSGEDVPIPNVPFAHGAEVRAGRYAVLASYHVSQQNTFTGRLTPRMFDAVLRRACARAGMRRRSESPPKRA